MDSGNDRVLKFDQNGAFLLAWGSLGNADTEFYTPLSVAVGPEDRVTVTDRHNHRMKTFTGTGEFVTAWSCLQGDMGDRLHLEFPMRIAVAKNGLIYLSANEDGIFGFAPGGVIPTPGPTTIPTASPTTNPTVPAVSTVPGGSGVPLDPGLDGKYEDVNGNGRKDFADVVLFFNQMTWIAGHEPMAAFDYNGNGRIDFADVVWLFNHL